VSSAKKSEPQWIAEEILVLLHAQQVERFGGLHGVLDENVVLGALNRPINRWAYGQPVDLADLAAVYLVAFAGTQGFNDGNKRTGLACALVFLEMNGISFDAEPQEIYDLSMQVATHQIGDLEVAVWFRQRISKS